jgi:GGDEF domain-containing protein
MVAQRVVDGVAAVRAADGSPVSVTAGVARFPADGTDAESVVAAARAALERARAGGRGRGEATE